MSASGLRENVRDMTNDYRVFLRIAITVISFAVFSLSPVGAQQQQPTQQNDPQGDSTAASSKKQSEQSGKSNSAEQANPQSGTSNDRLFYTLPNFLTVNNQQLPPLTTGQKFKAVARGSFDYVEYPWYGALAGISQAENSEPGFGQGAEGYGKRYASAFADGTIENFMVGAILPSIFKEDPRFYEVDTGTFLHRTGYAVSRIFITRTDSGHEQFNFSEILGSALSAGISTNTYHPRPDRNFPNTLSVWGTQVGYDTVTIVVKEFWPDIRRKISRKQPVEPSTP